MRLVVIGGSDAGVQAALRARELDRSTSVTVVLADAYPNFSICGIPYYVSGDVGDWHNLAHRTVADLQDTGMSLRLDTVASRIDPDARRVIVSASDGREKSIDYDALIIGTGAVPVRPPIAGLDHLGPDDGVHLLHTMESPGAPHPLEVHATDPDKRTLRLPADVVLVSVGVRPDAALAAAAGAELGIKGAIVVDRQMRTNLADILAAGDCVTTYHRLLGNTYLPLGTTAHKQGRIAGESALGEKREFAGSLGTQVVKVFDLVAARTGLRDHEATTAGFDPLTVPSEADDHKAYYPGSHTIAMRYTGDRGTGLLLGVQLVGRLGSEVAKRIDVAATAIFNQMTVDGISDLDVSYTPPLGSPWDALQHGAQEWTRQASNRVPLQPG